MPSPDSLYVGAGLENECGGGAAWVGDQNLNETV